MKRTLRIAAIGVALVVLSGCVADMLAPPPPPKNAVLMHYWHFNNLPEGTLTTVPADFTVLSGTITYPGTGLGYMDRVDPGATVNAQLGQPAGFGLRPRNPANTRELLIVAPSNGYEKLIVSFAAMRSSNGAAQEVFEYSANGGTTWTAVGNPYDIPLDFELKTINLSAIEAVNNNANLRFRIRFVGAGADGSSGNNRLDNLVVEGIPR
jgi:hypothetical protein